jgi:hypothetical protein
MEGGRDVSSRARNNKTHAQRGEEYEVISTTTVLGHGPGEKFHAVLEGAHRLLVGSHLKQTQKVQPKSDEDPSREKEEK